jgi:hypothetical protein
MLRKSLLAMLTVIMVFTGASVVLAGGGQVVRVWDEDADAYLPMFNDGRLNAFDIDAPVAVFYHKEPVVQMDPNGGWKWKNGQMVYLDVIQSLDIYARLPGSANFQLVSCCPMEQLNATVNAATEDTILWQKDGYTLGYSVSGWFWISAPNGYYFAWEK